MKRFLVIACAVLCTIGLAGCSGDNQNFTNIDTTQEYHDSSSNDTPTNYMDEIKTEVHDELFREETAETLEIVNRIFKHLDIKVEDVYIVGDEAIAKMEIKTINAARAWIEGSEKYVKYCANNLFSESYVDDGTLYKYYLDEFEDAIRKADYITIPVDVEMDYENCRWVWRLDEEIVNAITGYLLAAIEGDVNSYTEWVKTVINPEDQVEVKIPNAPAVEVPLFEKDGIKITGKGISYDNIFGPQYNFNIVNNSGKDIVVQVRGVSINGIMVDPMMSCEVLNGKQANDSMVWIDSQLTSNNITTITEIEFSFHIFEKDSWDTLIDSDPIKVAF